MQVEKSKSNGLIVSRGVSDVVIMTNIEHTRTTWLRRVIMIGVISDIKGMRACRRGRYRSLPYEEHSYGPSGLKFSSLLTVLVKLKIVPR